MLQFSCHGASSWSWTVHSNQRLWHLTWQLRKVKPRESEPEPEEESGSASLASWTLFPWSPRMLWGLFHSLHLSELKWPLHFILTPFFHAAATRVPTKTQTQQFQLTVQYCPSDSQGKITRISFNIIGSCQEFSSKKKKIHKINTHHIYISWALMME